MNFREVVSNYLHDPVISPMPGQLIINKDDFEALPEDIQGIILRDFPGHSLRGGMEYHMQCEWAQANAETEFGVKLWAWSAEDTARIRKQAIETIWPDIAAKSPNCARLVELVKEWERAYGRL